ncbi:MAG: hypothetical protein BWY37_01117 [Firmicutes bacterium ADurb.Bin262]|nr:MAG: hypothetical protein BWY37_01117 [Firmicutes bacterium ADurb.Bin262]
MARFDIARTQQPFQGAVAVFHRHFNIQPRPDCFFRVAHAQHEIRNREPLKAPVSPQRVLKKVCAFAALLAPQFVVRAHHRYRAGVDAGLEMRQIYLVQRPFVGGDVDLETQVFDAVARVVLDAGHHAAALDGPCQRGAHRTQQVRVLAVTLLRATPARVAQQIDTDASKEIGAPRRYLVGDGPSDFSLEFDVERSAPRHRNGEAGAVPHHRAARPVGELDGRDAQPFHRAGADGRIVVGPMVEQDVSQCFQ